MKATIHKSHFFTTVINRLYRRLINTIGIEEGLSNQKIYKIQKDARGYMWFPYPCRDRPIY